MPWSEMPRCAGAEESEDLTDLTGSALAVWKRAGTARATAAAAKTACMYLSGLILDLPAPAEEEVRSFPAKADPAIELTMNSAKTKPCGTFSSPRGERAGVQRKTKVYIAPARGGSKKRGES